MTEQHASSHGKGHTIWQKIVEEFRHFIVLFFYLWALFGLFVLNQSVVERQEGLDYAFQGLALLNALVLGKVMLVIESFETSKWLRAKALIWTILYEALVCTVLFLLFHVFESVVVGLFRGHTLAASVPSFGGGGDIGLMTVSLIMFVSLLPFFAFKNLARALGNARMIEILFRKPTESSKRFKST